MNQAVLDVFEQKLVTEGGLSTNGAMYYKPGEAPSCDIKVYVPASGPEATSNSLSSIFTSKITDIRDALRPIIGVFSIPIFVGPIPDMSYCTDAAYDQRVNPPTNCNFNSRLYCAAAVANPTNFCGSAHFGMLVAHKETFGAWGWRFSGDFALDSNGETPMGCCGCQEWWLNQVVLSYQQARPTKLPLDWNNPHPTYSRPGFYDMCKYYRDMGSSFRFCSYVGGEVQNYVNVSPTYSCRTLANYNWGGNALLGHGAEHGVTSAVASKMRIDISSMTTPPGQPARNIILNQCNVRAQWAIDLPIHPEKVLLERCFGEELDGADLVPPVVALPKNVYTQAFGL